jgi:hypothetical protein
LVNIAAELVETGCCATPTPVIIATSNPAIPRFTIPPALFQKPSIACIINTSHTKGLQSCYKPRRRTNLSTAATARQVSLSMAH